MFVINSDPINNDPSYRHSQFLNDVFSRKIFEKLQTPSTWNSIFPAECYHSDFSWANDCVTVLGKESSGTFVEMGPKEAKDVPTIDFSDTKERINLYDYESSIRASTEEIEKYQAWTSNAGLSETSYITQLVNSAVNRYNYIHNQSFFFGDGKRTKGLFDNPAMKILPRPSSDDIVQVIAEALSKIRSTSNGVIKAGTILISPHVYGLLNSYASGSDKSDLEKVSTIIVNTTGGKPDYLKIVVLDAINESISDKVSENDIFFLDINPDQFVYFFKPLFVYEFRNWQLRSYAAATKFKYSDPYIYTTGAISKLTLASRKEN
jgi:hypothetical protein